MRLLLGLLALAACSPVVAHTPDAKTADASPDAPSHGMVTVKVYDVNTQGAVVVGAPVVFVEADGTLVGHPVTAADGTASADVHAGASVTVVIASMSSTMMQTLLDVQPGDNIILGPEFPPSTQVGTFSVSFPTYSGAASYAVYGPCGSATGTTSPQVLTMTSDCKLDTMDITVVPKDSSGNGLAYITKTAVPFVANGTTSVTGAYTGMSQFAATYTNLNAGITSMNADRYVPDQNGFDKNASGTPANGMLTLQMPGPAGSAARVVSNFSKTPSSQTVQQGIAGNVQTYQLDAGMTLLPWVNAPTLDIANHKVTFSTDNTGTTSDAPDVAFAQVGYSRMVGTTTTNFNWLIIGPTATDMTLPVVPVEAGDVMPKMGDTSQGVIAAMVEADTLNGYGDVRLDIYKNINAVTDPPHPTAMKVRESLASGQ